MRIVVAIYQYIDLINVFKENLETLFPRGTKAGGGGGVLNIN